MASDDAAAVAEKLAKLEVKEGAGEEDGSDSESDGEISAVASKASKNKKKKDKKKAKKKGALALDRGARGSLSLSLSLHDSPIPRMCSRERPIVRREHIRAKMRPRANECAPPSD
jgi:hypothetical protein